MSRVAAADEEIGAAAREEHRDGAANACRTAGDDGLPVLQRRPLGMGVDVARRGYLQKGSRRYCRHGAKFPKHRGQSRKTMGIERNASHDLVARPPNLMASTIAHIVEDGSCI